MRSLRLTAARKCDSVMTAQVAGICTVARVKAFHRPKPTKAMAQAKRLRGERLQIMLTKEELQALDNWRFEKRMPSRASAVRELLKRGLTAEGFIIATSGTKSQDFGMIDEADEGTPRPRKRPG